MKKFFYSMLLVITLATFVHAEQAYITTGSWLSLRTNINSNFTELYGKWTALGGAYDTSSELEALFGGKQDADDDLTTYAGITPSANVQSLLGAADYSAFLTLLGVESGAEVNVNADWNSSSGDSQILNKPSIPAVEDTTYGATWDEDADGVSKNSIYDYLVQFDADSDGDFTDETWFPSTSGAPTDATYLTSEAEAGLSAENVVSANGLSIVQAADYAAMRALLDLEYGTDFNAYSAVLNSIANNTGTVDLSGLTLTIPPLNSQILVDDMADDDWGDFSIASNVATLDADVVGPNEMADGDHGFFTYSSGVASLDTDVVNDTNIDFGTSTNQVSAVDVPIADAGSKITATEIEGALQENRTAIDLNTAKTTNATHTGEVTGSGELTIADNIIEEDNLECTNSPTDNYVLTYDQSTGGFTWAEDATGSGGTAATASEINTGTDTSKYVTSDALAGSNAFTKEVAWTIYDSDTDTATGDGLQYFIVPTSMNGMDLIDVIASVHDLNSATGDTTTVMLRRVRTATAADMLTTGVTIGYDEYYANDETVDTSNDDIQTGDRIFVDVDAVTSGAVQKGLSVTALFRLP